VGTKLRIIIMSDFSHFWALLKQMPHADKDTIVASYSGNLTSSLREFKNLNPRGFSFMLADMENKLKAMGNKTSSPDEPRKRRFRSLILKAMQDQDVMVRNGDWSEVNRFVERFAGKGKSLSNMSLDELKKFNSQVHKLLDWHNMKKEARLRLAIMN